VTDEDAMRIMQLAARLRGFADGMRDAVRDRGSDPPEELVDIYAAADELERRFWWFSAGRAPP